MGSGFKMYASEMVEISPGATVLCGLDHKPVANDELCFVNAKAGLSLLFNVLEQSNQQCIINSLSIVNKTECLLLSNVDNKLDHCISWKLSIF